MPSIKEALAQAQEQLKSVSDTPFLEAEILLAHSLNISKEDLFLNNNESLTDETGNHFQSLLERRCKHEPIAYITGKKEFYGIEFDITKDVLIPRPETETLLYEVISWLKMNMRKTHWHVYDIGTGSGCIGITLTKIFPNVQVFGTDISHQALEVANANAIKHKVETRIRFHRAHLVQNIEIKNPAVFVANLPYIEESYTLPKDVEYEPKNALFSGKDGLDHYKELIKDTQSILPEAIFLEIGANQAKEIQSYTKEMLPDYSTMIVKDLENNDRVAILLKNTTRDNN